MFAAEITSMLFRWRQFYSNLLNVNQSTSHEGSELYTVEPDITEISLVEVELAKEKLKQKLISENRSHPIRINSCRWR